jgi:hypothetical protein
VNSGNREKETVLKADANMFGILTLLKQSHRLLVEFGIKLEDVISEDQDTKTPKGSKMKLRCSRFACPNSPLMAKVPVGDVLRRADMIQIQ